MSFFDFIFGNRNSEQQQSFTTTQNSNIERQEVRGSESAQSQQTNNISEQQSTQNTIDANTVNSVNQLIQNLVASQGSGNAANASDLAGILSQRAGTADADLTALIQPIIERSRVTGERALNTNITQLGNSLGTRSDTGLIALENQGRAELESALAAQEAELGFTARQIGTQELASAVAATTGAEETGSIGVANIAALLDAVKGGQITGDVRTEAQGSTDQVSALTEVLEQLEQGTVVTTQDGTTEGSQSGTLLDWLRVFA